MPFDEGLAERVRECLGDKTNQIEEKRMFGGLAFMVNQHMCVGIVKDKLMVRVGPEQYDTCLSQPHALEMDFTGRPMKGMLYVEAEGVTEEAELNHWLDVSLNFIRSLPPKHKK